jgi:lysophospholipase L1-like esterase
MRYRRLGTALVAACAMALTASACDSTAAGHSDAAHSTAAGAPPVIRGTSYYLSLGDSLAVGVQPDSSGASVPTEDGYANRLYGMLHGKLRGLRLVKLGCSGETTVTMIHGGICSYPGGSQLAAAEAFLRQHRGRVALVTIDIGANDPNSCILGGLPAGKIPGCVNGTIGRTLGDLRVIMSGLRSAGGNQVPIIGMTYYVPELAGWLVSRSGKEIAVLTERLVAGYNGMLSRVYRQYGAEVANVFGAFRSADFTSKVRLPGYGLLPRNVATVCDWTWACASSPRGPNEHANNTGYAVIARQFLLAYTRTPG